MKIAGKQTAQRKSASVISPGSRSASKWTSYLRALTRKLFSSRKVRAVGKGPRGRRQRV